MTIEEFGSVLNLKPSYIKSHWNRIVECQLKQDIEVYKIGRGDSTKYGVKFPWDDDVIWDIDAIDFII